MQFLFFASVHILSRVTGFRWLGKMEDHSRILERATVFRTEVQSFLGELSKGVTTEDRNLMLANLNEMYFLFKSSKRSLKALTSKSKPEK